MVNCWREQIHKFKTEYLLIWQKYLSTWTSIKYFGLQVQVSTKYFWILYGQVQVSTKYSIICIKYQVPITSTLLDPNPGARPVFRDVKWVLLSGLQLTNMKRESPQNGNSHSGDKMIIRSSCMIAQSYYVNQCQFITHEILWLSFSRGQFHWKCSRPQLLKRGWKLPIPNYSQFPWHPKFPNLCFDTK